MTALPQDLAHSTVISVVVDHELDIATLPRIRERLEDALSLRPDELVLDLAGCAFLDAQAVTLLLDIHRAARRQGSRLVLQGCGAQCRRLLALAGVAGELEVVDGPAVPLRLVPRSPRPA